MSPFFQILLAILTIIAIVLFLAAADRRARRQLQERQSLRTLDARLAHVRAKYASQRESQDHADAEGEGALLTAHIRAARDGMHGFTEAPFERHFSE